MKQTSTTETPATSERPQETAMPIPPPEASKKTRGGPSFSLEDDAPRLSQADFDRARFRVGMKDASRADWQTAVRARVGKLRINIMLDAPIVDHFKALAGERGYQTLINDTLRRVIETGHLEADLRRVIREELHPA